MKKIMLSSLVVVVVVAFSLMLGSCSGGASVPDAVDSTSAGAVATATPTAAPAMGNADGSEDASAGEIEAQASNDAEVLTDILSDDYEDALSARNQLALGSMRLEDGDNAVTAEQAGELALYWQALKTLSAESTTASEETTALQDQIVETMTPEQLSEISAMQLTNEDLNAFYTEMGIEITTPELEAGVTPQPGRNKDLTTEEREAKRAEAEALGTPVGTNQGSGAARRDVLMNTLIELLLQRASE